MASKSGPVKSGTTTSFPGRRVETWNISPAPSQSLAVIIGE